MLLFMAGDTKRSAEVYSGSVNLMLIGDSLTDACFGADKAIPGYIISVTKANPGSVNKATHLLASNDSVYHHSVLGMTELNGNIYTATVTDANNYTLGVNTTSYGTHTANSGKSFVTDNDKFKKHPRGYLTHLQQFSKQRFITKLKWNRGISSEKSADVLARIGVTPIAADGINLVILMIGTNDFPNGVSLATYQSNVTAIISAIHSAGARVCICTVPPRNADTSGQKDIKDQANAWIMTLGSTAAGAQIYVADVYTTVADGSRNWQTNYTYDNVHPSARGAMKIGEVIWQKLSTIYTSGSYSEGTNLLTNGSLTGSSAAPAGTNGFIATSWGVSLVGPVDASIRTLSKNSNDQQEVELNLNGTQTSNEAVGLIQTFSSPVSGTWYKVQANLSIIELTGDATLVKEFSLALLDNTNAVRGIDSGATSGTPTEAIGADTLLTKGDLSMETPAFKYPSSGLSSLKARVLLRCDGTGTIRVKYRVKNISLVAVSDPYS